MEIRRMEIFQTTALARIPRIALKTQEDLLVWKIHKEGWRIEESRCHSNAIVKNSQRIGLVSLGLWHINHCRLFNAKYIFKHIYQIYDSKYIL